MKLIARRSLLLGAAGLLACLAAIGPGQPSAQAQWPAISAASPDAQRNALNIVQSQVNRFRDVTRSAPTFAGGYDNLRQQFDALRAAYYAFKQTLTPQQLYYGANDFAELDAGLDIIQEGFGNYEQDIASGRPAFTAINSLCRVLSQATDLWWRELKQDCARLRIGTL